MLRHADLFCDLPEKFYDSAFLDRLHYYIPGWEVDIIRSEMFSSGYGFVVDYLAEILRVLRNHDYSDRYQALFSLSSDISTRDRDGIHKTFSGLMKILYPHDGATPEEIEEILRFAIEGRKRVKDQLLRIDSTYTPVRFAYQDNTGQEYAVQTLEETEYPGQYHQPSAAPTGSVPKYTPEDPLSQSGPPQMDSTDTISSRTHHPLTAQDQSLGASHVDQKSTVPEAGAIQPKEQHLTFQENQKGLSYDNLFRPYLLGAAEITLTDPYLRLFYQVRNLMEFVETLVKAKADDEEMALHVITVEDEFKGEQQRENFEKIQAAAAAAGVNLSWEFDTTGSLHARHIVTDHGWKISLDRGLDIFQHYEMNDAFSFANRLQQYRACKAFEVTYIRQAPQVSIADTNPLP
jgi:ATP-dependent Lon protease